MKHLALTDETYDQIVGALRSFHADNMTDLADHLDARVATIDERGALLITVEEAELSYPLGVLPGGTADVTFADGHTETAHIDKWTRTDDGFEALVLTDHDDDEDGRDPRIVDVADIVRVHVF